MRLLRFDGSNARQVRLFASLVVVFYNSAAPLNFEQLATASELKRKLLAASDGLDGNELARKLKPGPQDILLRNSEWEYLAEHLTPPVGRWPNSVADDGLEVLMMLREAPQVAEAAKAGENGGGRSRDKSEGRLGSIRE